MNEIPKAKWKILSAIKAIDEELELNEEQLVNNVSIDQINKFRENLQKMLVDIQRSDFDRKNLIATNMGHIVVDSWPIDSRVGSAIIGAEYAYRELEMKP